MIVAFGVGRVEHSIYVTIVIVISSSVRIVSEIIWESKLYAIYPRWKFGIVFCVMNHRSNPLRRRWLPMRLCKLLLPVEIMA